jgi:multidrug efflux system membrane fusion protein
MKSTLSSSKDKINELLSGKPELWDRPRWHWYALACAVAAAFLGVRHFFSHAPQAKTGGPAVPVAAATAIRGDIPVYLDGLGSVTAFYTVNLHSRVDGQLMSVPVKEGQYVHEGDVLAQIDPRPYKAALDQAQGLLAKDAALLTDAKLDLERYKVLVDQKAVSKQQLDTQVGIVGQYEGNVKTDQAAVEAAQLNMTYSHITSPISGRVGLRQVDPGNIVHASDANPMFIITQLHPIAVVFTLPEDNLPAVMQKLRAGAKLTVEAYNRDKSQKLATGTLLTVDNEIDPNSGTAKLKALFDNNDDSLFPNQFVNVRLLLDTRHGEVIVPSAAIQTGSKGKYVYAIKPDNTVDLRYVKVGVVEGDNTSLDSGVEAGEGVVTDGADKLQPGSAVSVQAPAGASATPSDTDMAKRKGQGKKLGPS